jgi:hypothetical protein
MSEISVGRIGEFSAGFVPPQYRQDGREEEALRFQQSPPRDYLALSSEQIDVLSRNNNTAEDWDRIQVTGSFDPRLVRNCQFWGLVRIGGLSPSFLEYHEMRVPVGFSNSTIISCDIGSDAAIHNVHYLARYIIGERVILINLDEMHAVNHAKFGNGIVKDGEPESVRVWLEVGNENGGRSILPFDGMLPADAWIWSRYREASELLRRLQAMTDRQFDSRRGYYGVVGDRSVIKSCRIIKDTLIGPDCYIKGANKLKNLTINSSAAEPTQIGEGVELVNGIVGFGNRIFYGVKAVRFLTGRNVHVKYGARLLNTFLGANSTVSCCELLNNLIFPFHEQHHNNSFLTASTLLGQSNIAAAASIGSNHNSRAQDGEILAGRGFWPGLASSFKHSSRFASYVLAAKASYPCELDITLPFSLVSMSEDQSAIQVMPGYWFEHNMFAIVRNPRKYRARDKRAIKEQTVEYDFLAPDTAEEMIRGMEILRAGVEGLLGRALTAADVEDAAALDLGLDLRLEGMAYKRQARIQHPVRGYHWYRTMLRYYGAVELKSAAEEALDGIKAGGGGVRDGVRTRGKGRGGEAPDGGRAPDRGETLADQVAARIRASCGAVHRRWENLGGQIVPEPVLQEILTGITTGSLASWGQVHEAYQAASKQYPLQRRTHALFCALLTRGGELSELDGAALGGMLQESIAVARELLERAYASRSKDFTNPMRQTTFRNQREMQAVWGKVEEISFLKEYRAEVETYCSDVEKLLEALA